MKKRFLSLLLALSMLATMIAPAYAEEMPTGNGNADITISAPSDDGSGTENPPETGGENLPEPGADESTPPVLDGPIDVPIVPDEPVGPSTPPTETETPTESAPPDATPAPEQTTEPETTPPQDEEIPPLDEGVLPEVSSSNQPISLLANEYNINSAPVSLSGGGDYTIVGNGTATPNTISLTGGTFNIEINNVQIDNSSSANGGAFIIGPNTVVNLTVTGTNMLIAGANFAGIQVPESSQLTILGAGTITAQGGSGKDDGSGIGYDGGAGIGGGPKMNNGPITIDMTGTVNAVAGKNNYNGAAGIGGGASGAGANITIVNGVVNAYGGENSHYAGAGIGGGSYGASSDIEIRGGTVTANAGTHSQLGAAGIGGGCSKDASNITITGGTVSAKSSYATPANGAAIGGGFGGNATNISISGGNVTAIADQDSTGRNGAGVGGGGGTEDGTGGNVTHITITGGTVRATGASSGAGIGGGANGTAEDIQILGGTVTAAGGVSSTSTTAVGGAGIGGGSAGDGINILIKNKDGLVTANGGRNGAGIGGGIGGDGINITIESYPGEARTRVNAYSTNGSDYGGSGIGGGQGGAGINISIDNAVIDAAAHDGAGIGSGYGCLGFRKEDLYPVNVETKPEDKIFLTNIKIVDSDIHARAMDNGAAIGTSGSYDANAQLGFAADIQILRSEIRAGMNGNNTSYSAWSSGIGTGYLTRGLETARGYLNINIQDCPILYVHSGSGAGIGTGYNNSSNGDYIDAVINIKNCADVKAYGHNSGTGIGLGFTAKYSSCKISIKDCKNLYAETSRWNDYAGAGIGSGGGNQNCTVDATITNCNMISTNTLAGAGIGLGAGNTNVTGTFVVDGLDPDNMHADNASSATITATTTNNSASGGAALGTGRNDNSCTLTLDIKSFNEIKTISQGYNNSDSSYGGAGIGTGSSNSNSVVKMNISQCANIEAQSQWAAAIGLGGRCNNNDVSIDFTDCGPISAKGTSTFASGIGSGYGCSSNESVALNFLNCGDITTTGNHQGAGIGFGASNNNNKSMAITISNCGNIQVQTTSTYAAGIGLGYASNNNESITVDINNSGNISVDIYLLDYGGGIGTAGNCQNSTVDIKLTNNGDVSAIERNSTSNSSNGACIGSGYSTYNCDIAIKIIDCVNINTDVKSFYGAGIGAGYNCSNTRLSILIKRAEGAEKKTITAKANHQGTAIGSGANNYSNNSAQPYRLDISFQNYGDILTYANNSYVTHIGIGRNSFATNSGAALYTDISIENCGNIIMTNNSTGYGTGIGTASEVYVSSGGIIDTNISVLHCGDISVVGNSDYQSVGIGTGRNCRWNNNNSNNRLITTITIDNCGDITVPSQYDGVGIGKAGYNRGNELAVSIKNCGAIIANADSDGIPNGSGAGVGIGCGYNNYQYASGDKTATIITITGCESVTATGEKYGAGIGVGRNSYGELGLIVTINDCNTVSATGGTGIGSGYNVYNAGTKATINMKNNEITAVATGEGPGIGVGGNSTNGVVNVNFENCTVNSQAEAKAAPIGYGVKTGNSAALNLTLTNCNTTSAATKYAAGLGGGASNTGAIMSLLVDGGRLEASGAEGGAGIGGGVFGMGCAYHVSIENDAEVIATGSGSTGSEFDVYGSSGNPVLDIAAKAHLIGAGAGIGSGGERGTNPSALTIESGTVTAIGGAADKEAGENMAAINVAAAGIGGGSSNNGILVTVNGGTVIATGGKSLITGAAGIGGGSDGNGGELTINGGSVTATGTNGTKAGGAGIGGGSDGDGGSVVITDGTVVATASERGAGIGGGDNGRGGDTKISGGDITVIGGHFDTSGIGYGTNGIEDGRGTLTVSGSPVLKVYAMPSAPAISSEIKTSTKIFQGTMKNVSSTQQTVKVKETEGEAATTVVIPANYVGFATTLSGADGLFSTYLVEDGKDNLLVDKTEAETFEVTSSASTLAELLNIIRFWEVTYHVDGGSEVKTQSIRDENLASIPEPPAKKGFMFAGWFADEALTIPFDFANAITENTNVYAKWIEGDGILYKVEHWKQSLDTNDGYVLATTDYLSGKDGDHVIAEALEYTGFHENGTVAGRVSEGTLVEGEDTLVLKLYYDRNVYTVRLENIDDENNTITAVYGTTVVLMRPSKEYYTFDKWTMEDGTVIPNQPVKIETLGSSIYANWVLKDGVAYSIRHYLRGLDNNYVLKVAEDHAGRVLDEVTATPNDYPGFHVNDSISNETKSAILTEGAIIVLKVYYDRDEYTVNFKKGLPDDVVVYNMVDNVKAVYGTVVNLPTPACPGYAFLGWYKEDGVKVKPTDTINEMGSTLTARWEASNTTPYEVRYYQQNLNDDGYSIVGLDALQGKTNSVVEAQIKNYQGFHVNKEHPSYLESGTVTTGTELKLSIYYDRDLYSMTFDSNGGSEVAPITDTRFGTVIPEPEAPTKQGYDFGLWHDVGLTIPYEFRDPLQSDVTVYAKWIPRNDTPYAVLHYVENGAGEYELAETDSLTGTTDSMVEAELNEYEGCSLDEAHEGSAIKGQVLPDGSLTLKVYYSRAKYTADFDANGGSEVEAQTIYHGNKATAPETTRLGYDFGGWFVDAETERTFDFDTAITEDVALIAKWTARDDTAYTVKYLLENLAGNDYEETEVLNLEGTTDTEAVAEEKEYEGFELNDKDSTLTGNIAPDGSLILVAKYDRIHYTVSYESNGGEAVEAAELPYGSAVTGPEIERLGYMFSGWYTDEALSEALSDTQTLDGNITLYAKWTARDDTAYTVKHYVQAVDGLTYELVETESLTGTTDTTVQAEAKKVDGCTLDADHAGSKPSGDIAPDGGLELVLYYKRNVYTVSFSVGGGSKVEDKEVLHGAVMEAPATIRPGYTFDGWYVGKDLYDFETPVVKDLTLTAKWVARKDIGYTVCHYQQDIDLNGYTLVDAEEIEGTTDEVVTATAKDFTGFTENPDHKDRKETGTVTADGKLVLALYYDRNSYKATFDSKTTVVVAPQTVIYGQRVEKPVLARDGYTFEGWFTAEDERFDFSTVIAEDVDLTAKWTAHTDTAYQVEHYLEMLDGSYELADTDRLTGTTDSLVTAEYKTYIGFTSDKTEHTVEEATIAGNGGTVLKLYYSRNSYEVSFNSNGGTDVASQTVKYGATATMQTPERAGYNFSGWFLPDNTLYDFACVVSSPVTLTARWVAKGDIPYTTEHYQQTVDGSGYELIETENMLGVMDTEVAATAKSYKGFHENKDLADRVASGTVTVDSPLTLKLYYDRNKYTVSFDSKTEVVPDSITVTYGGKFGILPDVKQNGYTFNGWYTSGGTKVTESTVVDILENITLTAKWDAVPSGSSSTTYYKITVIQGEHGAISPNKTVSVQRNGSKTFTIKPDAGYYLVDILVDGVSIGKENVAESYKMEKIKANHTIEPVFECPSEVFTDFDPEAWYHMPIDFVVMNGYFVGRTDTSIAPNAPITRAELATILARISGAKLNGKTAEVFDDVPATAWYADAIALCEAKGYMIGYGDGNFGPGDHLTREQLALTFYRYFDDRRKYEAELAFVDTKAVSKWAELGVEWAVATGIIIGDDHNRLRPQDDITRAETAAMVYRLMGLSE